MITEIMHFNRLLWWLVVFVFSDLDK